MNVEEVLNFAFPDGEITHSQRDVMLYALGLGLGREDLPFVYEKDLQVLPSFAMVAGHPGSWMATPALGVEYVRLLHAEQSLEVYGPLPANGRLKPRDLHKPEAAPPCGPAVMVARGPAETGHMGFREQHCKVIA